MSGPDLCEHGNDGSKPCSECGGLAAHWGNCSQLGPAAPAPLDPPSIRKMRHCLEQIVVVMCEKGLADDLRLSEIQDHLSIAGFDVPLRSYDTRGAVQAERQRAPNIPAGVTAYLDWKASGDSSPSNLVHAILQAVRDSLGGNPK